MKAALNGVPSFSRARWLVGRGPRRGRHRLVDRRRRSAEGDPSRDAVDLYIKLERVILPLFYGLPFAYAEVMRSAIALNGSFFNTQRMVEQYVHNAYFPNGTVLTAGNAAETTVLL